MTTMMKTRWAMAVTFLALGIAVGAILSGTSHGQPNIPPPPIPAEMTSYRNVVKRLLPAVVSIEARAKPKKSVNTQKKPPIDGVPKDFKPYFEEPERKPETPDDGNLGFGSGFLVDPTGIVLTNFHVVEGADELEVQLYDGRKFITSDFKFDRRSDIAVVRVKTRSPLPFMEFGDSDAMEIGDRVLAIGAPFGLRGSVTSGIVSAKGRSLRLNSYEDFIQTDAAVNPGNSGGPLINLEGRVIGITSAIKTRGGSFSGVGLAIASNLVRSISNQLIKDGFVKRGYIGALVDDLDPDALIRIGVHGVKTSKVVTNSPAAKAGIRVGDIITMIADKPIKDARDMQRIVGDLPIERPASVTIIREGKLMNLTVTITDYPEGEPARKR
jgi:serine protease Do